MSVQTALMDTPISYDQLEEIEDSFEDVELELLRQSTKMTKDLYAKREALISQIPHFWALVFEMSPPDVDEYIQPTDSALIASSLTNLTVERFELESGGDPRSLLIRFEFSENEYFENKVLEKKFWWRRSNDGWAGLVSEPVDIKWKEGKDLTNGMLSLVQKVWEDDKAGKKDDSETEAKKALKKAMEETGLDGVSFFAFFGYRGRDISAEENVEATKKEAELRQKRKDGTATAEDDEDDDDDEDEYEWEIFPTADDLAVALAEDIYPGAIKYFTMAQEQDGMSDVDFLSGEEDDEDEEMGEADGAAHPSKKRKA